ncbi:MAG: hypothetical protein ABR555_11385 [Pyrinomonadaceae bacterium]
MKSSIDQMSVRRLSVVSGPFPAGCCMSSGLARKSIQNGFAARCAAVARLAEKAAEVLAATSFRLALNVELQGLSQNEISDLADP